MKKKVGHNLLIRSADPVAECILVVGGPRDADNPVFSGRVEAADKAVELENSLEGAQQVHP